MLKRATEGGTGPWRVSAITNWIAALAFAPWWLMGGPPVTLDGALKAALAGALFFAIVLTQA